MKSNINDHDRYELLLSTMGCKESCIFFRAAFKVWTAFRRLPISEAIKIGEGLIAYSPDNDLFAGFCAANYKRYLEVRRYHITDVIFTRDKFYIGYIFCYKDSSFDIECHKIPLLQYDHIKHSRYGNYFYQE